MLEQQMTGAIHTFYYTFEENNQLNLDFQTARGELTFFALSASSFGI